MYLLAPVLPSIISALGGADPILCEPMLIHNKLLDYRDYLANINYIFEISKTIGQNFLNFILKF